jgi:hypothetical protein
VREALVQRLARLSPAELREQLREEDAEARRAAVLACARRADREFVPDLVALGSSSPTWSRCGATPTRRRRGWPRKGCGA